MRYLFDRQRHLVCEPYSRDGMHEMARFIGIKRCWFHGGRLAHYDVPKKDMSRISLYAYEVSPREILRVIKSATAGRS